MANYHTKQLDCNLQRGLPVASNVKPQNNNNNKNNNNNDNNKRHFGIVVFKPRLFLKNVHQVHSVLYKTPAVLINIAAFADAVLSIKNE